jgi:hypothetical protein
MTTKAAFSPEEWKVVLEGPPTAGMIVVTAARGGTFRETIAMGKAYTEARGEHGESELLDEIVATKPKADHTRCHSVEGLRETDDAASRAFSEKSAQAELCRRGPDGLVCGCGRHHPPRMLRPGL